MFVQDKRKKGDEGHMSTKNLVVASVAQEKIKEIGFHTLLVFRKNCGKCCQGAQDKDNQEKWDRVLKKDCGVRLQETETEEGDR
jgi:hypothetical protein